METLLNNRYRIISRVGEGGFASVYKAEDLQERRIVAIKAISLKALSPQEMIDATDTYNREIRFGTTLYHTSLPEIYDHFTDQDHWYIVVKFIEGQTLEAVMERQNGGPLPLQDVLKIGVQVCDVLAYLHSRRPPVIFRDIKPDNLMRTARGDLYLIDFGIARQFRPGQRKDTQALGSPGYAAPEQYGSAQTTERSDIYSLGATLRALLTGVNPLDASDEDYQKPGVTLQELIALLMQMTEKDPEKRPETIEIVRQRLERITRAYEQKTAKHLPLFQAPIFQSTPPVVPVASKRPVWPRVLLAAVLVLIAGSVGSLGLSPTQRTIRITFGVGGNPIVTPQVAKAPADQQVLTLPVTDGGLDTLDPAAATEQSTIQVANMLYSGLVQIDDSMHMRSQLAASWQQSADGLTWTFTLRPKLKFSDGTPLTSMDVAYSIDRALDPATQSIYAPSYLEVIKDANMRLNGKIATLIGDSIITPDPQTIQIRTAQKEAFFLDALTCTCAYVVEKTLINKYGKNFGDHLDEGGGSGPFKFAGRTPEHGVELVPNPYYYGPRPQLIRVTFVPYSGSYAPYNAYLDNQVSLSDVSIENMSTARTRNDFHQVPQLWEVYYGMNYLTKPFDNIKIRQAFALAANKTFLARATRRDTVIATNHIIPRGQDGYNPALMGPGGSSSLSGNSELAKKLLQEGMQEEGISGVLQLPPITLTYPTNVLDQEDADTMWQAWKDVLGINVQLQGVSYNELVQKTNESVNNPHGLQMWYGAWIADYPDPRDWTTMQFGKGSPYNTVNYGQNKSSDAARQQQVQQELQEADGVTDMNARMKIYQQAEQQLVNDVAWLPLYQSEESYVIKSNVHGYTVNALNLVPPDNWGNIYITA